MYFALIPSLMPWTEKRMWLRLNAASRLRRCSTECRSWKPESSSRDFSRATAAVPGKWLATGTLAEVQVKQFLHFELVHQVGHPAEVLQGIRLPERMLAAPSAHSQCSPRCTARVFQQHPAIRQLRFGGAAPFAGSRRKSPHRAQVKIGSFPLASSSRKCCATGRKKFPRMNSGANRDMPGAVVILAVAGNVRSELMVMS